MEEFKPPPSPDGQEPPYPPWEGHVFQDHGHYWYLTLPSEEEVRRRLDEWLEGLEGDNDGWGLGGNGGRPPRPHQPAPTSNALAA